MSAIPPPPDERDSPVVRAVAALRRGGLVVLPTETVYGLGADAANPAALRRVFEVKGRPADHPLIVHIADARHMDDWAVDIPAEAWVLAAAFWPGPLTLVLRRAPQVPLEVTGGRDTIALRVPDHPLALAVLRAFGGGIAAPSANRFGRVSPTTVGHVDADIGHLLDPAGDVVLDGGPCAVGVESTIVEFSAPTGQPTILRPGGVPAEQVEAVLGARVTREASGPARAPGMLAAHYSPDALVVPTTRSWLAATVESVRQDVDPRGDPGEDPEGILDVGRGGEHDGGLGGEHDVGRGGDSRGRIGVLGPRDAVGAVSLPDGSVVLEAPQPYTAAALARVLYARLREADESGLEVLVIVEPDIEPAVGGTGGVPAGTEDGVDGANGGGRNTGLGAAVLDRLARAARGHQTARHDRDVRHVRGN